MFANAFFDNVTVANQYWIFRPNSSSDIQNGDLNRAHFSQATGRTSFGPNTNPHPYLTDGTPENSFESTDIRENGNQLTFHVHFFSDGTEENNTDESLTVYPNPVADRLAVNGAVMRQVELVNIMGQRVLVVAVDHAETVELSMASLPSGVYLLRVLMDSGSTVVKKVVKE